ncbi:MAG TPA: 1,4-alpha-glucan branching enzyme, partial [Chloroflexia bacterium]|nr:1,4-alpha-glucan branching enzyme [Chloroflexia bacterium]
MPKLSQELIDSIVSGHNADPFAVLGPHRTSDDDQPSTAVRAYLPWAQALQVVKHGGETHEATRIDPAGLFEAVIPGDQPFD